jgi:hypothetical protein
MRRRDAQRGVSGAHAFRKPPEETLLKMPMSEAKGRAMGRRRARQKMTVTTFTIGFHVICWRLKAETHSGRSKAAELGGRPMLYVLDSQRQS